MGEYTPQEVAALLMRAGLASTAFDPVAIAADLTERTTLDDTLEALLAEAADVGDFLAFDPRWPG